MSTAVFSQPRLEVPNATFEFGYAPKNSTLIHQFWFKSTGTDTVVIDEIKTGCSCAVMPLKTKRLAPGDSMLVTIYWKTQKSRGKIYRFPRIFTNAGPDAVRLYLSTWVPIYPDSLRPVTANPYKFIFGKTPQLDVDSLGLTLTNHSNRTLAVKMVNKIGEEYEFVLPDTVYPNSSSSGYVKLKPEFVDSEFEGNFTIEFSDPDNMRITFPVVRKFYGIEKREEKSK